MSYVICHMSYGGGFWVDVFEKRVWFWVVGEEGVWEWSAGQGSEWSGVEWSVVEGNEASLLACLPVVALLGDSSWSTGEVDSRVGK